MGCLKLHILEQQYKKTELKVSYFKKELTPKSTVQKDRSNTLIRFIDPDGMMPSDVVGNEDCCPGTQSPQSTFNQALGKLESLFNTVVENVEDALESLSPEKIEIEKEGSTEKATVDHDGLATAKEGDQVDNGPETSGKVETLEETMPVEGVPPSETDRANTLWDIFIDPFIELYDPAPPKPIEGDSVDRKWSNHLNGGKIQTKRSVKLTNGNLGAGRWLNENEESNE